MQSDLDASPDDCRLVALRDVAEQSGVSLRTLKLRLQEAGISIIALTPRRLAIRHRDFQRYLAEREI